MLSFPILFVVLGVAAAQLFPVPLVNHQQTEDTTGPFQPVGPGPFQPEEPQTRGRPAPPPTDVDLVIVGVTTGNRNPQIFLPNDPSQGQWGEEGPGQLNNIGKREALGLGRALRQRYRNMVSEHYYRTNFVAISSTGESEQMTAQVVNTGMFPPVGRAIFDPSIQSWQPVPVTTDNTILGLTRLQECQAVRNALRPIFNGQLPEIRTVLNRERDLVDYITENTGIQGSLEELAEVAENLRQMQLRGLPLPQWAENPTLRGFDRERLLSRVQVFRNAIQVACSIHEPCRRVVSGLLLNQIVQLMSHVRNVNPSTETDRRNNLGMVVYTGDQETILSVLRVLNINHFNVPTTGGFVFEVRTTNPPTVRVLFHQPDSQDPTTTNFVVTQTTRTTTRTGSTVSCMENFCPVQSFLSQIRSVLIPTFRAACGTEGCTTPTTTTDITDDTFVMGNTVVTNTCPDGTPAAGTCVDQRQCGPGFTCTGNLCCTSRSTTTCPDGSQPVGTCVREDQCRPGFTCTGNNVCCRRRDTFNDIFVNPTVGWNRRVDCSTARDQYPRTVCRELARGNYCNTSPNVRNVRCRRTCNCGDQQ